jgi:LuxR family maltose regulon positive regulatory protein
VLLSRSDPELPLHGLRAHGDLTEIRAADLAFTAHEADTLLTGRSVHLRPEQLDRVMDRTSGWPAGVQAAALTIDPADIETGINDFCAPDRAAADYLVAQILNALSPMDRDFLLRTSSAEMVNGDLAAHLTGRSDSQLILERLFDDGFFTVRRGQDGWYSYQPMLRDLLAHSAGQFGS